MDSTDATAPNASLAKTSAALAAAAVVAMVVLAAMDADGPIWIIQGALALGAAVTGFRAGGTSPRAGLAFAGFLVGTVLFLVFAGFLISEA